MFSSQFYFKLLLYCGINLIIPMELSIYLLKGVISLSSLFLASIFNPGTISYAELLPDKTKGHAYKPPQKRENRRNSLSLR